MKIGVIGSGKFKKKKFVLKVLEKNVNKDNDIIVSGHSPRNNFDNVDIWAEIWAYSNCHFPPIIFKPEYYSKRKNYSKGRNIFFERNRLIAEATELLYCFIPINQYKSGTWNTIKHFVEQPNFQLENLIIFNNKKEQWVRKDYPDWLLDRLELDNLIIKKERRKNKGTNIMEWL